MGHVVDQSVAVYVPASGRDIRVSRKSRRGSVQRRDVNCGFSDEENETDDDALHTLARCEAFDNEKECPVQKNRVVRAGRVGVANVWGMPGLLESGYRLCRDRDTVLLVPPDFGRERSRSFACLNYKAY